MDEFTLPDERLSQITRAAEQLAREDYAVEVPIAPADQIGQLGRVVADLARNLERRSAEVQRLAKISRHINAGFLLEEVLDGVYRDFRAFIPYDRIGLALLEEGGAVLRARWARTELAEVRLSRGYAAPMAGSSLADMAATGRPRIINDLAEYLRAKPSSNATRLIVAEGLRSSLTCPLVVNGMPIGFIFFSSAQPNTYAAVHVDIFQQIAEQLAAMVEKGRLVSELSAQKAEIEQQNNRLRQLAETQNAFLGMAAHDLRNPLQSIRLGMAVLTNPAYHLAEPDRQAILGEINGQVDYVLALLNDLLDVAHIEAGRLTLQCQAVEVAVFLAEIVRRHAQLAAPKSIGLALSLVAPGQAWADPLRLRQVLDNLISNAVKFSPRNSTVRVSAAQTAAGWRLAVADEGPGLTPRDRERLFQDFAKLSAQPTGGEKSTGLGLAISRRVVEAHGGQIGVDSEPGRGATFWVTLPNGPGD